MLDVTYLTVPSACCAPKLRQQRPLMVEKQCFAQSQLNFTFPPVSLFGMSRDDSSSGLASWIFHSVERRKNG
jgi:hypothetical protein